MIPFQTYDLSNSLRAVSAKVKVRIDEFADDELMANDVDILCRNVYEEFKVIPVSIDDVVSPKPTAMRGKVEKYLNPVFYFDGEQKGQTPLIQ